MKPLHYLPLAAAAAIAIALIATRSHRHPSTVPIPSTTASINEIETNERALENRLRDLRVMEWESTNQEPKWVYYREHRRFPPE